MKHEIFATHTDGRKLYYPEYKNGESVNNGLPTVAVSIDQYGQTFPEGSTWIRGEMSWGLQRGWKLVTRLA